MTYQDILKQIEQSGTNWSQWDLDTARQYPEFGASMLSYKQDWGAATDQAGRDAANAAAEQLRRQYGNYTGGPDGSRYYSMGPSPGGYQSTYQSRISDILDKMAGYGDFSYGEAPTYNNRYQAEIDRLLNKVQNYGPFSYDKAEDPSYAAYVKQYRREGDRAAQQALAQAAAASGGQVSSAAMTAASQAGDYYAGQLADKIPELYQNAYNRYLSDYQLLADQLGQTQGAEQMDYAKYLDQLGQYNRDRSLSYDQWLQGYNMLGSNLSALQSQDQAEYGRLLDQVGYNNDQRSLYQNQVDAILQAGGTPSAALAGVSGYSGEYIDALRRYYAQQAVSPRGGSSRGVGVYDTTEETEEGALPSLGTDQWYAEVARRAAEAGQSFYDYAYAHRKELDLTESSVKRYAEEYEGNKKVIRDVRDLGPAAQMIANSISRSYGDVAQRAEIIEGALNRGAITQAEADFLLRSIGF